MNRMIIATAAAAAVLATATPAGAVLVPRAFPGTDTRTPTAITAVVRPAPGGAELTGTLTTAGGPVTGATVTFTTAGAAIVLCTATTDGDGLASCVIGQGQVQLIRTHDGIWYARFAGDATLAPVLHAGHIPG